MKAGWEMKTLGDLFEITSSKRVFKSEWKTDGVPFYRAREIVKLANQGYVDNELFISDKMFDEYSAKFGIPKEGDIMVTGVGTLGICYVVQKDDRFYFKDGNIIWLKKKSETDSRFVEYAFRSVILRTQIDDAIGATVGTFTIIKAKNTFIPIPSLSEQQRIVAILDEAFEGIATAKANADKNLKNARQLFESHLNSVFSQRGDGWVEDKLVSLTTKIGSGATPRGGGESYKTEGTALIRSLNIYDLGFKYSKLAFLDDAQADGLSNVILQSGDVLLNITGASVARCCTVPGDVLPARVNQHVSIIRPIANRLDSEFLHYLLISKYYKNQLLQTGAEGGATRQAITKAQIQDFTVRYPADIREQKSIVDSLDSILQQTQRLESIYQKKIEALDALKKSILQKAFSGKM